MEVSLVKLRAARSVQGTQGALQWSMLSLWHNTAPDVIVPTSGL